MKALTILENLNYLGIYTSEIDDARHVSCENSEITGDISAKTTMTPDDSLAVIFTMMIKHGLSKSCIPDLLNLIPLVREPDADKTSTDPLGSSYKLYKELSKRRKEHLSEEDVFWRHYTAKTVSGDFTTKNVDVHFAVIPDLTPPGNRSASEPSWK